MSNRQLNQDNAENTAISPTENKFRRMVNFIESRHEMRINVVSNELELRPKGSKGEFKIINESEILYQLLDAGFSKVKDDFNTYLAVKPEKYDPIKTYFEALPAWDCQTDYISQLASFVEIDDSKSWFETMFKKFIVRCVAQAIGSPNEFNKQCLTLVGKQNDGKTTFLNFLTPPCLERYTRTGFNFSHKDGLISLTQNFFINLDELASFEKRELNNDFKTTLSQSVVKFRMLYDKNERPQRRRANFVASTNQMEFLTDETGNVRWLVFRVNSIKHDLGGQNGYSAQVNIDNVWSQAFALYQSGFAAQMTPDEISHQEAINRRFIRTTAEMELIQNYFEPAQKGENRAIFLNTTQIEERLRNLTSSRLSLHRTNIGKALQTLGFKVASHYEQNSKYSLKGYWVRAIDQH